MKPSWAVRIVLPLCTLVVMAVTASVLLPRRANHPELSRRAGRVELSVAVAFASPGGGAASGGPAMAFGLHSKSFAEGGEIPRKYSCDGEDISPELNWSDPPAGTQSLALIADDPDAPAGTWVHWVAYDIPPQTRQLPEGAGKGTGLSGGGQQGRNDFRKPGYGGPCPPPGKPHRYFFKMYALDTKLNLKPGASKTELEQAMKGHILAQAQTMGTFKR